MPRVRWMAVVVCGAALVAPTSAWADCTGSLDASGAQALEVGGATRHFVVRLSSAYDGRTPAPVVFAFHPFGMNAQYMQSRAPIGRAWPEAVVVYPEGMGRGSESMAPSWQGRPGELGDRDLKFFDAMLAWLDGHACADRARVFVLGYSNGAQLTGVLACERSSAIAGAAMAAGRLNCTPSTPKPVVLSHGLADRTADYSFAVAASKTWASQNGCAVPPRVGALGCFSGEACGAGPVTICTHAGGHEYDLPFTRTAAEFFKNVPVK